MNWKRGKSWNFKLNFPRRVTRDMPLLHKMWVVTFICHQKRKCVSHSFSHRWVVLSGFMESFRLMRKMVFLHQPGAKVGLERTSRRSFLKLTLLGCIHLCVGDSVYYQMLTASLASSHKMPQRHSSCDNRRYLQQQPRVPGCGVKSLPVEILI